MNVVLTNESGELLVNYNKIVPCGSIINYSGDSSPNGWLICDGSEISKTTYSNLFSVIGTKYGSASNINNFKLPDLSERLPIGKSVTNNLGNIGGSNSITLSTTQMPSHTHTGTSDASGAHIHTGTSDTNGSHTHTGTSDENGTHTHTATDSGHVHSYDDAYFAENRSGGQNVFGTSAGTDGDNDYYYRPTPTTSTGYANITVANNGSHSHAFTTASNGSHNHAFTTASNGSHSHTFTTGTTGGGESIDIRNRYIVLNYIIKI
jgi:microcystin-dependent protein